MTLRNLMTSLLALTLMVFVGGCDSELDETSNLAVTGDISQYCGEGTEPNADGTQCVPATFVAGCLAGGGSFEDGICIGLSCGDGTEPNADGTQCVPVYECFRGGFCSEAAAREYFTEAYGNIYAEDTIQSTGCDATADDALRWDAGVEFIGVTLAWAVGTYRRTCAAN